MVFILSSILCLAILVCTGIALPRVRQALVVYHMKQPVSERRAEELPWLLERLSNWSALRSVLTDLHMLDYLWTSRLKGDLLRYWGILTGVCACVCVCVYACVWSVSE